ncbi:AraC family transcriptional regulator, partial [Paracraurococcus ruber]|uniref:helix-turn-helix domain-containing protein n=1 Tax=Paracraurococcus ruber TaxID=77675 RepID=UPI001057C533
NVINEVYASPSNENAWGQPRLGAAALAALRQAMEDRLAEPLSLADLAGLARMPRHAFLRAFRAEQGETPAAYLARRRVARALPLLAAGLPPAAVAARCGFADPARLLRAVRRQGGLGQ